MNRRDFLRATGAVSAGLAFARPGRLFADKAVPAGWRTFEATTRVEILKPSGTTRIWLPAALDRDTPYQRTVSNSFDAPGGKAELFRRPEQALSIVSATFEPGVKPVLTLTSRASTKNYGVDLSKPGVAPKANRAEIETYLQATKMIPTDGLVKVRALEMTRGARTDVEKARAIYEWIVDNTFRNPKTRGCGVGDIKFMVESGDLGGKCADLNALYVGFARAVGLPARHVYGLRTGKSELGFKSLGPLTENATKGQHCRVEVWLAGYGWVPVDPADVRKVVLEEPPGNLPMDHDQVVAARKRLFGSWEMNWMAFNYGHDVDLPGSAGAPCNYFMYPHAETADGRVDPFDADNFRYEISSKEVTAAA